MKRSKLETYYHDQFGGAEPCESAPVAEPPPRAVRRRRPARRRLGPLSVLKLTLMFGPMAVLLAATLLMDCQGGQGTARGSWMPEILRGTACARRDLAGRVFSLDANLRTIASSIR